MSVPNTDPVWFVDHRRLLTAARMVQAVRPENWDDDEDPDQVAAWSALEEALRPLEGTADVSAARPDIFANGAYVVAQGWGVAVVFGVGVIIGAWLL